MTNQSTEEQTALVPKEVFSLAPHWSDLRPSYFLQSVEQDPETAALTIRSFAELENENGETEITPLTQTIPAAWLDEVSKRVGQALPPEIFHQLFEIADNAVKQFGSVENFTRETFAWLNTNEPKAMLAVGEVLANDAQKIKNHHQAPTASPSNPAFEQKEYELNLARVLAAQQAGNEAGDTQDCGCN